MKDQFLPLLASLAIFLTTSSLRAAAPTLEGSRVREQLNEMQGQPAPKLALKGWINAEPMTLKKLKGKIVVLDFWATWCGPCRAIAPVIEELHTELEGKAVIGKVNIDENSDTPVNYGVRNIPTLLVFKNGEVVDKVVGNQPKSKLLEILESHM